MGSFHNKVLWTRFVISFGCLWCHSCIYDVIQMSLLQPSNFTECFWVVTFVITFVFRICCTPYISRKKSKVETLQLIISSNFLKRKSLIKGVVMKFQDQKRQNSSKIKKVLSLRNGTISRTTGCLNSWIFH